MQTLTKTGLAILVILAIPLSLGLMLYNWSVIGEPLNLSFLESGALQTVSQNYLFWGGLVLTVILIGLLFAIMAWPKSFLLYRTRHNNGQLRVTRKAIDNFTLSSLRQEPFISDPKVTTKLSRKRLKIKIHGTLRSSPNAALQSKQFTEKLERDLKQLLGIDHDRKIDIHLTNFKRNRQSNHPRVV
ncbi:alkaline shock response membrane anchor protein AmaP [Lactobacillus sp. LC28-10]|uniref:Alkaline shock response membrane anchor protein AmaP n=1 Tax=Secundilactobacillus angelensis TaxID=2722706 RepID=A0ABX1KXR7_9LACO|nr:alkaline shock response membrane anchor protein AmaP [Secundilactobacillus angelensis]MCH5461630.1 alkaline shock response membrane anchor protein AmaP [Secundilactobacillus angelensis]NLR17925.1 alkaline shock response membrane anchor protein AmaP [Secundilactobacillus angelensis]